MRIAIRASRLPSWSSGSPSCCSSAAGQASLKQARPTRDQQRAHQTRRSEPPPERDRPTRAGRVHRDRPCFCVERRGHRLTACGRARQPEGGWGSSPVSSAATRWGMRWPRQYARADLPKGEVMLGAVVDVSCQPPSDLQVEKTKRGIEVTATDKGLEVVQCLVPVTTVALGLRARSRPLKTTRSFVRAATGSRRGGAPPCHRVRRRRASGLRTRRRCR